MAYLDTSVLAAYYCPEELSRRVQQMLQKMRTPAISPLVEVEFASALSMKVRTGQLDSASANKVLSQFQVHVSGAYYEMLPIHLREYTLARDWISRFTTRLRTLDALHLAVAFSHGQVLLTADKALASSGKSLGIKVQMIA